MVDRSVFFFVFLLPLAATFLLCPLVRRFALLLHAVDRPDQVRHCHTAVTPRLGGLSLLFAAAFTLPFAIFSPWRLLGILLGMTILAIAGMADDICSLTPKTKLLLQTTAALFALFPTVPLPALPVALLYTVGLTNALNLIDGLDGLASGYGAVTSLCLSLGSALLGNASLSLPFLFLGGGCLGFLPHNLRTKKLFLGDTGSQLIGYLLAVFTLPLLPSGIAPVGLTLLYPITETATSLLRRLYRHRDPFAADRGHFHHRLLDRGMTKGAAVRLLLSLCMFGHTAAIAATVSIPSALLILTLGLAAVALVLFGAIHLPQSDR